MMSSQTSRVPKVVLVNDTSQLSAHFGTQLVGQAIREQLSRVRMRLIGSLGQSIQGRDALFRRADLILINGEGSLHHGRHQDWLELAHEYRCALINTVWHDNPPSSGLEKLVYVAARESLSAEALRQTGITCDVVPDVSFASQLLGSFIGDRPRYDLGISDGVGAPTAGFAPFTDTPQAYLRQMTQCRRLCLGRFHAVVAASVLKIPFSAWASNTHKTQGMLRDMGLAHQFFATQTEALAACPDTFDPVISDYVREARKKIRRMFDTLRELATTG